MDFNESSAAPTYLSVGQRYELLEQIGAGSFGEVYRALDHESEGGAKTVALKKIRPRTSASIAELPSTAVREMCSLQQVEHDNIICLRDTFVDEGCLVMVLDYMECDMQHMLSAVHRPLHESEIKCIMRMLLKGLAACHQRNIIHRDIKPSNVLFTPNGRLCLADFGLARVHDRANKTVESLEEPFLQFPIVLDNKVSEQNVRINNGLPKEVQRTLDQLGACSSTVSASQEDHTLNHQSDNGQRPYTHQVATRWYRAPELLFGAKYYGSGVDIWAVGCVLAELFLGHPIFQGQNDIDQIYRVIQILGTIDEEKWQGAKFLPDYNKIEFPAMSSLRLDKVIPRASKEAIDLLNGLLAYDPTRRLSCVEALQHPFFCTLPKPAKPDELIIPLRPSHAIVVRKMIHELHGKLNGSLSSEPLNSPSSRNVQVRRSAAVFLRSMVSSIARLTKPDREILLHYVPPNRAYSGYFITTGCGWQSHAHSIRSDNFVNFSTGTTDTPSEIAEQHVIEALCDATRNWLPSVTDRHSYSSESRAGWVRADEYCVSDYRSTLSLAGSDDLPGELNRGD